MTLNHQGVKTPQRALNGKGQVQHFHAVPVLFNLPLQRLHLSRDDFEPAERLFLRFGCHTNTLPPYAIGGQHPSRWVFPRAPCSDRMLSGARHYRVPAGVTVTEGQMTGRLTEELLVECAEWIWEQMQDDGMFLSGELVELVLKSERELGIQGEEPSLIALRLEKEFADRGIDANPAPIDHRIIKVVLDWEDDFLGFAGIPRSES